MRYKTRFFMLVALFAVSALILGFMSLEFGKTLILKNNETYANFIAYHARDVIEDKLQNKIIMFKTLTDTPFLQQHVKESNEKFSKMKNLEQHITSIDEEWKSTAKNKITPVMKSLIDNPLSKQLQRTQATVTNHEGSQIIAEIIITNEYGVNVAQTGKTTDYIQSDEKWWIEAKENGLYIEDVNIDESAGVYSVDIATALKDFDGNFIGVRKVVWTYADVLHELNHIESEFDGKVDIIMTTKTGKTLYRSSDKTWFEQIKDNIPFEPALAMKSITAAPTKLDNSYAYAQLDGFDNTGLGWFIIVNTDNSHVVEPLLNQQLIELGLIFVVVGFASFATLSFSKSMNKKIKQISKSTENIANGDFETKIHIKEKDEFSTLVDNINTLGKKLSSNQEKLIEKERLTTIGEISAKIAHDMRNPLSVQKNILKIMSLKKIPGTKKYVQMLEDTIERLSHQVEDIMDYLRDTPIKLNKIKLHDFLKEIVSEFDSGNNINCSVDCPEITIQADKYKLKSVVINILHNAKQAIGNNSGWIRLDVSGEKEFVSLSISNSGPNIPESYLKKIFKPLFTTKQRGTGLGLRSVQKIVEEHHGSISVSNDPVTFTIRLPTILVSKLESKPLSSKK